MQELKLEQTEEINSGVVAVYWVGKALYLTGKAIVGAAVKHKIATAGVVGFTVGVSQQGEE